MNESGARGSVPVDSADGGAEFHEPWQIQLLALADSLIDNGVFSAKAWSQALGEERARDARAGMPDTVSSYYEAALRALEKLLEGAEQIGSEALAARRRAWERAYRETPHGQPVVLKDD